MPDAGRLLDVARGELGTREDPPNSNLVKYSYWYPMPGEPWCAMFVSWCADVADCTDVIPKHAYTPDGAQWFKDRGQWHTSNPQPGDVVYYQWATSDRICHVGIVENTYSSGAIDALEGNTDESGGGSGGKVMRQRRTAYIVGYGRPKFDGKDDEDVATYYCEIAQNTGQEVDPDGEDIRMQEEHDDPGGWHSETYPSIAPKVRVGGNAAATVWLSGPAEVRLRTYSTDDDPMATIAAQESHGEGYVNLAGYCKLSVGHKLRLWVGPTGSDPITARYAVLSLAARET